MRRLFTALSMTVSFVVTLAISQGPISTSAQESGTPRSVDVASADPEELLRALMTMEMDGDDLPAILPPSVAVVQGYEEGDEDIAGAVGGVAFSWEEVGVVISLIVYATEGEAVATFNAYEAEAEADETPYSEWEYVDGVSGFCLPVDPEEPEAEAVQVCLAREATVLVIGVGPAELDESRALAHAGARHVAEVAATVPADDGADVLATPIAVDPEAIALVDTLLAAPFQPDGIPPVFFAYDDASTSVLEAETSGVANAQGAVRISWPSSAPDLAPDATIDLYIFATEGEANAAAGTLEAGSRSAGLTVSEFDYLDPVNPIRGRCIPVDPADSSEGAAETCWAVTGTVLVTATGEGGFGGARDFLILGVEHVAIVSGD